MKVKSVEFIPEILEQNVLYVSLDYSTAIHLCMCGCKNQVVTPLNSDGWQLKYNGSVTLSPSIGNWRFKCRSHYWIRDGKVSYCSDHNRPYEDHSNSTQAREKLVVVEEKVEPKSSPWLVLMWRRIKVIFD